MSQILGLEPAAQVVILQGLSTYAALASAYFFARPVLRGQTLSANREILANLAPQEASVARLLDHAAMLLDQRAIREQPRTRRANRLGIGCLVVSFVFFTMAIVRQIETDPNLRETTTSTKTTDAAVRTKAP